MKPKIREILDDCISDGLRSGYRRAHKYDDEPCEETMISYMEDYIWLEIDRKFDFDRNVCDEVVEGFDHLGKKRSHAEFLEDLDDWAMSDKREWVGLTTYELQDLTTKSYVTDNTGETHFNRGYFADAIEAKLKENNT